MEASKESLQKIIDLVGLDMDIKFLTITAVLRMIERIKSVIKDETKGC